MKKIFFLLIPFFIFFCGNSYAQDSLKNNSKKLFFGLSDAANITQNYFDNLSMTPALFLGYKHFMLTVGPKMFFQHVYGTTDATFQFRGFNTDLRYIFGKTGSRFRFYVNLNLDYLTEKYNGKMRWYDQGVYTSYDQVYAEKTLSLNAGAGLQVKIYNGYHFFLNAGGGYYFYAKHDVRKDIVSHEIKFDESISLNGQTGLISAGIFCIFDLKKLK